MNEVELIKSKLDIAEVIASYIELKPAGRNFKALSPFKSEKTPSFMVSPEKGIWHDFSSGEGGDVISFVMRIEGISFIEALEMLARRAGVELTKRTGKKNSSVSKQALYDAIEAALAYYHVSLSKNKSALNYLTKDRKLSTDTIKKFKLGYSPDSWSGLTDFLRKKKFTDKQIIDSGLAGKNSRGLYDLFRGRIMFPIYDNQSRPVGFSARLLASDSGKAKYINTPATAIYNKSLAIYGLAQAKEAIRTSHEVLLVEGNMDVIGLAQAGITNVVAVSGTALTIEQLRALGYLADSILVAFDADNAGQAATKRAIEMGAQLGTTIKVVSISSGKDPDEAVRDDKAAFLAELKKAVNGIDYLFTEAEKNFSISSGTGKKQFSDYLTPVLAKIADPVEQAHYVKLLAQKLQVPEEAILSKLINPTSRETISKEAEEVIEKPSPDDKLEERLLELLLAYPELADTITELDSELFSKDNKSLFAAVLSDDKQLQKTNERAKILALRGEEHYGELSPHDRRLEAYSQAHLLRTRQLKTARATLSRQLVAAEQAGDTKQRDIILNKIQATIIEDF